MTRNRKIKELRVASMLSKIMRSKNHTDILGEYYKRLRIPGAEKYSREMKNCIRRSLIKLVF